MLLRANKQTLAETWKCGTGSQTLIYMSLAKTVFSYKPVTLNRPPTSVKSADIVDLYALH